MRVNKNEDTLFDLFQESKTTIPDIDLEDVLMQNIKLVIQKKNERKQLHYTILLIVAVLCVLFVPFIVVIAFGLLPDFSYSFDFSKLVGLEKKFENINFQSQYLFIPYTMFFLLVLDLLVRKKIWNKEHSDKEH